MTSTVPHLLQPSVASFEHQQRIRPLYSTVCRSRGGRTAVSMR